MPQLVLHVRIDLAAGVLVRDHLAAAGEVHERAVVAPGVFLELATVAAAGEPLQARRRAEAGHAPAAAELDVIAARETELAGQLLLVEPPGRVHVPAARAIFVVRRKALEQRNLPLHGAAHSVHEVVAHLAARVGEPMRKLRGLRVEQDAHRLARARGQHDHSRGRVARLAGALVDVADAARLAVPSEGDFAHHGVGEDVEIAGRQRRRQMDGRRLIVGAGSSSRGRRASPRNRPRDSSCARR